MVSYKNYITIKEIYVKKVFVSFEDPIVGRVEEFLFFFLKSNFMVVYG